MDSPLLIYKEPTALQLMSWGSQIRTKAHVMKKILTLLLATFCFNAYAHNDSCCDYFCDDFDFRNSNRFYAEIFGGANFLQSRKNDGIKTDYKTGYIVSGSLGYRWCYGIRTEFEYAFRRNSLRHVHFFGRSFELSGHFQSSSYMANMIWDLPLVAWGCNLWNIQPFFGGGIGYDVQRIHASSEGLFFKQDKKQFAWQFIAGFAYPILCNVDISLEYKYHKGGFKHLNSQSVGIGLTYVFGG